MVKCCSCGKSVDSGGVRLRTTEDGTVLAGKNRFLIERKYYKASRRVCANCKHANSLLALVLVGPFSLYTPILR